MDLAQTRYMGAIQAADDEYRSHFAWQQVKIMNLPETLAENYLKCCFKNIVLNPHDKGVRVV